MDESYGLYSIKNREQIITFDENLLQSVNGHDDENSYEDFPRCFSIDHDDVVLLDQSQIISHEVKSTLNNLLNNIQNSGIQQSQIISLSNKRSLDNSNHHDRLLNKKVRFNIPDDEQNQQLNSLFISENFHSINQSKPCTQFLYNLGFDLCLEHNLNDNNHLSEIQKQTLIKRNKVFHQYKIYSCKYCSFRTNTIYALKHHYQTPHTVFNSTYSHKKYRCTYCSFKTFRIPLLRRHFERRHGYQLITEHSIRRYSCSFCYYESDDKNSFVKHNNRCQIEQTRTRIANNLLAPFDQLSNNAKIIEKNKKQSTTKNFPLPSTSNTIENRYYNEFIEPIIIIESDHDISSISGTSSSDEDFIVSSDEKSSSSTDNDNINDGDFAMGKSRSKKIQHSNYKLTTLVSHSNQTASSASNTLSSLSKLLLLNGTPVPSFTSSPNATKSSYVSIQPKPANGSDIYQDYLKHMNDKHNNNDSSIQSQQIIPPSETTTLNNITDNTNTTTLIITNTPAAPQPPTTIFLLSTNTMDPQSITLNMIKCPWCDTNFEHIDIMTGHLMRYHRMTLAASKVVVAEQMKLQGTSSNQLTLLFKAEIEQIQKDFIDKMYWKISQPKVYLHQIESLLCFVCRTTVDNIENHFLQAHQIELTTMNIIKQCCLCGFKCDKKNVSLFEHQLRAHSGVCYSSILKQFIRFEPPPSLVPKITTSKVNNRFILPLSSSNKRSLVTCTEKKFGCRKCDTSSRLFTFEELVEHLHEIHKLNVKLHRRCIICQETFSKGKEYNQHCLEHLNDENPSIEIKRQRTI
ncbi:unnamed protein product [Adineta steineri]|uniref:C2H2-type domain-containing protein n=2 Tax=Adineta steineri TaxID=433720 RepID=A0A819IK60_9BILA|nr:unnamed protein product [Adineta steineri]